MCGHEARRSEMDELERMEGELRRQVESWRLKKDAVSCSSAEKKMEERVEKIGEKTVVVVRRRGRQ